MFFESDQENGGGWAPPPPLKRVLLCGRIKNVQLSFRIEEEHYLSGESDVEVVTLNESFSLFFLEVYGGNADDYSRSVFRVDVEVKLGAHHLVDLELTWDSSLALGRQ